MTAIARVRARKNADAAPPTPMPAIIMAASDIIDKKLRMRLTNRRKPGRDLCDFLTCQSAAGNAVESRFCHSSVVSFSGNNMRT